MRGGVFESICTANYNSRNSEAEPFILDCGIDERVLSSVNAPTLGRVGTAAATTVRTGPESFRTTVWINLDKV